MSAPSPTPVPPPPSFLQACSTAGLELSDAELDTLGRYLGLLLETNKQFNLTAIRDPETAWRRHILESLSLLPFLEDASTLADVGSGGGSPGVVLAVVRPDIRVTLIEATSKKVRFLQDAARELGLDNVRAVHDRAETAAHSTDYRERFDIVTARALGPMRVLLELTLPLTRSNGRVLAIKGGRAEAELREAGDALMHLSAGPVHAYEALPGLDDEAVIVEITKAGAVPKQYPRVPGIPKREPL